MDVWLTGSGFFFFPAPFCINLHSAAWDLLAAAKLILIHMEEMQQKCILNVRQTHCEHMTAPVCRSSVGGLLFFLW